MDASEKHSRVLAICSEFADQMSQMNRDDLTSLASAAEWGEAVDLLLAVLSKYQIPVSASQHIELTTLATDMDIPMPALNVTA